MSNFLTDYNETVYCVLNNCYDADARVDVSCIRGYVELLSVYEHVKLWLLPPSVEGLAAARSFVVRATAGGGPIIMMDDVAKAFALSVPRQGGGLRVERITFTAVAARLLIASR
jgi:hypothetical protein